jgi:hypothetical protein
VQDGGRGKERQRERESRTYEKFHVHVLSCPLSEILGTRSGGSDFGFFLDFEIFV